MNSTREQWQNAIAANTGSNVTFTLTSYSGTFADFQGLHGTYHNSYIGAWGASESNDTVSVWARPRNVKLRMVTKAQRKPGVEVMSHA